MDFGDWHQGQLPLILIRLGEIMKKMFTLSFSLLTGFFLAACSSSSSSSAGEADSSSSSSASDECTLKEEGVKILQPAGGESFKIGDSIVIKFVANYANAGSFEVLYRTNPDDEGTSLFENSIGDEAPDGTKCTTVKAYLSESLSASDEAFIRVRAYNKRNVRADSETFSVKE